MRTHLDSRVAAGPSVVASTLVDLSEIDHELAQIVLRVCEHLGAKERNNANWWRLVVEISASGRIGRLGGWRSGRKSE